MEVVATLDRILRDNSGISYLTLKTCANLDAIPKDEQLTVKIDKRSKKRSLTANSYAWTLLEQMAQKLPNTDRESIYREVIRRVGVFEDLWVKESAIDTFIKAWGRGHIGYFCDRIGYPIKGGQWLRTYYGSSTYDATQMARLIDEIVSECNQLGIDTYSKERLDDLVKKWGMK